MPGSIVSFSLKLVNSLVYKLIDIIANVYSFMMSNDLTVRKGVKNN